MRLLLRSQDSQNNYRRHSAIFHLKTVTIPDFGR